MGDISQEGEKMQVSQRDIVLLSVPFSNLEGGKVRPGLIVSNDNLNNKSNDCIIAPMTSVIKDEQYSVFIDQKNLSSGKLKKPSRIRADKIFSVEKSCIQMCIGTINSKTFEAVKKEIIKLL